MTKIRYLSFIAALFLLCATVSGQTDFNPASPAEPAAPVTPAAKYGLVLKAQPSEGGSPSGGGIYAAGASVTLNAKINAGFVFSCWTDMQGNVVSSAASFSYKTLSRPDTLVAHYVFVPGAPGEPSQPNMYYNLVLETTKGGSVSGGGRYLSGTRIYLSATANSGYSFKNWVNKSGEIVSTSAKFYYTTLERNDTLSAIFSLTPFNPESPSEPSAALQRYRVTASCSEGGTFSGTTGMFAEGATVSLRATANTGYKFTGWYVNGELFATSTQLSYPMGTFDVSIYAQFDFSPSSPGEPSAPAKENSLYLMTVNGLPGQERQFPVYLANQDTLTDMTFQLTFTGGVLPDMNSYVVSQKAADYDVNYTVIDDSIYRFVFTGGRMLPGNTSLLTFVVPIKENTELGSAFQIKINQVSVADGEGVSMAASTHNGMLRVGRASWLKLTLDDLPGSESVDLGLSVKWASKNVGTVSAEEFGDYYRWEDVSHSPSSVFGSGWRMPTAVEIAELLTCYKLWTTLEEVPGMLFIAQNAEDFIFIPAAGIHTVSNSFATECGTLGQYWSSTDNDAGNAYALMFSEYESKQVSADINNLRLSLRAVYDKDYLEGDFSSQEVENPSSGSLEEEIVKPDNVVELRVRGKLNGTDIAFIRSLKRLRSLDISEASIVEGGSAYYSSFHTEDDVAGDSMFCRLPNLRELHLCTSVKIIGDGMLANSTGITVFDIPSEAETVGNNVFAGCEGLRYVNWNSTKAHVPEELFGDMLSNCIIYAVAGVVSESTGNIVIDGMAEHIALTDALPFLCPYEFRTKSVSYSRSFGKATVPHVSCGWESIVLPFDVQSVVSEERGELAPFNSGKAGTCPFWLAELTDNGFSPVASIEANRPYIIAMPNSDEYEEVFNIRGKVVFSASDAGGVVVKATSGKQMVAGPDFGLVPAYETVTCCDSVYAINHDEYDGMLPGAAFVCGIRDVLPFEAYACNVAASVTTALYYSIGGMEEVSGIDNICHRTFEGIKVYSRDGVLFVESPRQQTVGLYSADGRLMRLLHLSEGTNREFGLERGVYFIGTMKILVM